jgi:hypothetical protein
VDISSPRHASLETRPNFSRIYELVYEWLPRISKKRIRETERMGNRPTVLTSCAHKGFASPLARAAFHSTAECNTLSSTVACLHGRPGRDTSSVDPGDVNKTFQQPNGLPQWPIEAITLVASPMRVYICPQSSVGRHLQRPRNFEAVITGGHDKLKWLHGFIDTWWNPLLRSNQMIPRWRHVCAAWSGGDAPRPSTGC